MTAAVVGSIGLAALDTLGVAMMLPLMQLLTMGAQSPWFPTIASVFRSEELPTLIVLVALLVAGTFVLKSLATILFRWWLVGRQNRMTAVGAAELLRKYVLSPYAAHRQREIADMYRHLGASTNAAFGSVLGGLISLLTNFATIMAIIVVLFVTAPLATLAAVVVFASVTLGLQLILKKKHLSLGHAQSEAEVSGWRSVTPVLAGFRDVRLTGSGHRFVESYRESKLVQAGVVWAAA
ncbi:hypothetical protein [Gulosibacter molinativorax]|nr:hypothetical protein [Gulosibacter molinativorax]